MPSGIFHKRLSSKTIFRVLNSKFRSRTTTTGWAPKKVRQSSDMTSRVPRTRNLSDDTSERLDTSAGNLDTRRQSLGNTDRYEHNSADRGNHLLIYMCTWYNINYMIFYLVCTLWSVFYIHFVGIVFCDCYFVVKHDEFPKTVRPMRFMSHRHHKYCDLQRHHRLVMLPFWFMLKDLWVL